MHKVNIRKVPEHDALAADVQVAGEYGAAQIRAVVPLRRIRGRVARRMGLHLRPGFTQMAGDTSTVEGCRCERATQQLAGLALMDIIKKAAVVPLKMQQDAQGRIQRLAKSFVAMDQSGQIEEMGGWEALAELLARRRAAKRRALEASGVPEAIARMKMEQASKEQTAALRLAMANSESGDMEGDDESGWNPFSAASNLAQKAARGLGTGIARGAHYAAVIPAQASARLTKEFGRGLYRGMRRNVSDVVRSHTPRNPFGGGGGGGGGGAPDEGAPDDGMQDGGDGGDGGDGSEAMDASQAQ